MKKLLSFFLVVLMLAAFVSVAAFAAASDWIAGPGYQPYVDASVGGTGWAEDPNGVVYPTIVKDVADGVQVTQGGTYKTGANWGGVASKEMYNLNGLEVTVRFDKVPTVTEANDCWIGIEFLRKPELFVTSNIAGNPGFMQLIRYGAGYIEVYEGATAWSGVTNTSTAEDMSIFKVKSGDVLKMNVEYVKEEGFYKFTYSNNGASFTFPYEFKQFAEVFKDGKAHIVITGSIKESTSADDYKYTILEVKDGVEKTAEDIAYEEIAQHLKYFNEYYDDAYKIIGKIEDRLEYWDTQGSTRGMDAVSEILKEANEYFDVVEELYLELSYADLSTISVDSVRQATEQVEEINNTLEMLLIDAKSVDPSKETLYDIAERIINNTRDFFCGGAKDMEELFGDIVNYFF